MKNVDVYKRAVVGAIHHIGMVHKYARDELKKAMTDSCQPIRDDYKRRHKN